MLRFAGIGVAMGNATDEPKAAADYVTDSVDDAGIANALKHFGVYDGVSARLFTIHKSVFRIFLRFSRPL